MIHGLLRIGNINFCKANSEISIFSMFFGNVNQGCLILTCFRAFALSLLLKFENDLCQWKPAMAHASLENFNLRILFFVYCIIRKLHYKIMTDYTMLMGLCKKHQDKYGFDTLSSCLTGGARKILLVFVLTNMHHYVLLIFFAHILFHKIKGI